MDIDTLPIDQRVHLTLESGRSSIAIDVTPIFLSLGLFIPEVLEERKVTSHEVPLSFAFDLYRMTEQDGVVALTYTTEQAREYPFTEAFISYDNLLRLHAAILEYRTREHQEREAEKVAPVVDALQPFTRTQLGGVGLSKHQLAALLTSGAVLQPLAGLYVDARRATDAPALAGASALVLPPHVVRCRATAAMIHGVDPRGPALDTSPVPLQS